MSSPPWTHHAYRCMITCFDSFSHRSAPCTSGIEPMSVVLSYGRPSSTVQGLEPFFGDGKHFRDRNTEAGLSRVPVCIYFLNVPRHPPLRMLLTYIFHDGRRLSVQLTAGKPLHRARTRPPGFSNIVPGIPAGRDGRSRTCCFLTPNQEPYRLATSRLPHVGLLLCQFIILGVGNFSKHQFLFGGFLSSFAGRPTHFVYRRSVFP